MCVFKSIIWWTKNDLESARANALRLGYQSCLAAAHATGNADGTTGGVGFLWPLQNKISNPGTIVSCHWAMSSQIEHANFGQILFVTFYGHQDSTITLRRLEDLIVKLEATGFCFIIAGDFNITSDDMSQWLPANHPHMQLRDGGNSCFTPHQCVHHRLLPVSWSVLCHGNQRSHSRHRPCNSPTGEAYFQSVEQHRSGQLDAQGHQTAWEHGDRAKLGRS